MVTPPDEFDNVKDIWNADALEKAVLDRYLREMRVRLADKERLRAVYGSHFFEQDVRTRLDGICATAAMVLDTPGAQVNLITDDAQIAVANYGGEHGPVSLDFSFCQHVVGTEADLTIEESLKHALVCNSMATTEQGLRSYLGVPLMTRAGYILGALCVWDYKPREWNAAQVTVLTDLAVVVMRFHEVGV